MVRGYFAKVIYDPVRPVATESARVMAINAKYQRKVPAVPRDYPRNGVLSDAGFARIGGSGELGKTL
jgi:hypothetical protein